MENKDEKYIILEQYKIYSDAKEKFIERQFSTNKFYLVISIINLVTTYLLLTLTPQYSPVIILSVIGIAISIMWWLNIDTYQLLIKVKYSKVLEYLETKLPEQPYHKEYLEQEQLKKEKHVVLFGDFQKYLTIVVACVYIVICINSITNLVRFNMLPM